MASGRKNRGSRHRSHKHKQQKADDSGDSDTEQNLRHGPMPEPNPNPNPSFPWTMEPLPPNVEGPSVLKQPDMENADRKGHQVALKGSHTVAVKRRKETPTVVGDAAPMDRWDGGDAEETLTLALVDISKSNLITPGDGLDRKDAKSENDGKNSKGKGRATPAVGNSNSMEHVDAIFHDNSIHTTSKASISKELETDRSNDGNSSEFAKVQIIWSNASETTKARVSKSSLKDKEIDLDDPSSQVSTIVMEPERKRVRKTDLLQKPKKSEDITKSVILDSQEEHHSALEKGAQWVIQDHVRNIELEKELESRIRRRREGSGERERWRDSGKEKEIKGPHFQNEEQYENEGKLKDEKVRQEKPGGVRIDRERSSSRHREESWKVGRHLEDKHKEESLKVDKGREGWQKDDKDREQRRKSDRNREDKSVEGKLKDDKQKEVMTIKVELKDDRRKEDLHKDGKERDGRVSEGRSKENRSRDSRYRDEKDKEVRLKSQGDIGEERLRSESIKREEYSNWHKEEKLPDETHQDDKQGREHVKEDILKKKDRGGKLDKGEEETLKDEKEKRDNLKIKYDKKKGETEQDNGVKHREESGMDHIADAKGKYEKKRGEREQDYGVRLVKPQSEKGRTEKQQDGNDMGERENHDRQRVSCEVNGKHTENAGKYDKVQITNDRDGKYRDDRVMDERDRREKAKDDGNRHSKHRDENKERRWEGGLQDERAKDGKESFSVQKHTREMDDRQRYDLTTGKQRGEKGKDDRKHGDKIREEKPEEMPVPAVADRLGFTKEASRQIGGGDKDSRRTNVDRDHRGQPIKQSNDLDRQLEPKGTRDPAEARESKGYVANKGDQTVLKTPRATSSQDQERVLSVSAAKDRTTSDNQPKRTQDSDTVDLAIADRDPARPRGRLEEEVSDPLYEDKALHDKYGRRSKFESSVSVSSSSCTRRPREQNRHMTDHADQGKQYLGFDEEVRSWEPRVSNQDSDDERRRLVSHERNWDSRPSLSPARGPLAHEHEEFVRGPDSMLSKDAAVLKRKRHKFLQGAGPTKARRVDEASVERLEQSHQGTQMNRIPTDGPMVRPLPPNRLLGHLALLPPPPPYRPGVDNPAVMGGPTNFVEGSNPLRESGRYDRKAGGGHLRRSEMVGPGDTWGGFGMGNWNAHNQGPVPGPGNMFPSFPQMGSGGPQMGSGGFLGVGQQFHVSQMYGPSGARPSADIGFGGSRFHMGDGGAGFPGHGPNHGPVMGWHRFPDGSESHHPLAGFMDTWEGPGRYPDERQRFGHRDWDQFSQGMSGEGWEGALEPWQGQAGDAKLDLNPPHSHNEAVYEARIGEEVSHPDPHMEKVQVEEDHVPETFEISPAYSIDPMAKTDLKASKRTKERMQMLLLHADVSAKLVGIDLYNEYLSLLPPSEAKKREAIAQDGMDVSTASIDEDLEFEVDSEAQDLLLNLDPYAMFLPSLSDSAKDALKIYHRPMQQNSVQKSVFGSFLLPESSLMITMPSSDIEPVKRGGMESFGEQAHIPMGLGAQTEATCFEVEEAKETVEVHLSEETCVANAVESFDRHAEGFGFVGNKEQGSAEYSVLGCENPSLTWQASESYVQSSKNLENDQKIHVNEIFSDHPSDHLEASQVIERKHSEAQLDDDDDQTRPVNEVYYSHPADDFKASQVVERDDSQGELVEDKGVDFEVLASSSRRMEELGRSFEEAEAIEISDPKESVPNACMVYAITQTVQVHHPTYSSMLQYCSSAKGLLCC